MFRSIRTTIFRGLVQLLNWISLMCVRCVFVQYAAVCHCRRLVCVSGAPAVMVWRYYRHLA